LTDMIFVGSEFGLEFQILALRPRALAEA
jgi:hypothetical protein